MYRFRHPLHPSMEANLAVSSELSEGHVSLDDPRRRGIYHAVDLSPVPAIQRRSSSGEEVHNSGIPHAPSLPEDLPVKSPEDRWEEAEARGNDLQGESALALRRNPPGATGRISFHPRQVAFNTIYPSSFAQGVGSNNQPQKRPRFDHYGDVGRTDGYNWRKLSPSYDRRLGGAAWGGQYDENDVQTAGLGEEEEEPDLIFSSQDEQDPSDTRQQQGSFYSFKPPHTTSMLGGGLARGRPHKTSGHLPFFSQAFSLSNSLSNFEASYGGQTRSGETLLTRPVSSAVPSVPRRSLERQSFYSFDRARGFNGPNLLYKKREPINNRLFATQQRPPLLVMPNATSSSWRNSTLGILVKRCVFTTPLPRGRWVYSHCCSLNTLPHQDLVNSSPNKKALKAIAPSKEVELSCSACISCALICSLCRIAEAAPNSTYAVNPCTLEKGPNNINKDDNETDIAVSLFTYYAHNSYRYLLLQRDSANDVLENEIKREQ
ncbi:unnamed protein product [Phytomonas sp. Hart1]|nr:unnamed protein product [Phytomonas sp. Hart1]|eukprot:CCW68525.1 unnamed protein product [Phytomonas sp. isolate Hart1]